MLLLSGITDLQEERRKRGFSITLHKIRAHTNIRGNDLVDAAAILAIAQYDSIPELQSIKVDIEEVAPRPRHWVMYTARPPPLPPQVGTETRTATLRLPWWSIPEGGVCRPTPSHAPHNNSDIKPDTRYSAAFTVPPYTAASYLET